jgi:hypothetical protein
MATGLVLAIAANGEVGLFRQSGKQRDESRGRRLAHFVSEAPRECCPALRRPRFGHRPRYKLRIWREVRKPHIKEVAPRVILLPHSARRTSNGAHAQPFAWQPRCPESHDANSHISTDTPCGPLRQGAGRKSAGRKSVD